MLSIIICTALILATQFLLERVSHKNNQTHLIGIIFIGLETLCNQRGSEEIKNISIRIICFLLRIITIFSISAYGADITSYLAIRNSQAPFSNLTEFLKTNEYKLVIDNSDLMGASMEENPVSKSEKIKFAIFFMQE